MQSLPTVTALAAIFAFNFFVQIIQPATCTSPSIQVCNNVTQALPVDFLFLVDGSSSMCPYINEIVNTLDSFISLLTDAGTNSTFAVAAFGGAPALLQPFSTNATMTKKSLSSVGCSRSGWEAGLEAVRVALASNNGSDFTKSCSAVSGFSAVNCVLNWRRDANKQIILVTDEDSDIPFLTRYRMPGQVNTLCPTYYTDTLGNNCGSSSRYEPPFQPRVFYRAGSQFYRNSSVPIVLEDPYYNEINATAQLIIKNSASVTLLVKSNFNANVYFLLNQKKVNTKDKIIESGSNF
jgi:hypothetical protein